MHSPRIAIFVFLAVSGPAVDTARSPALSPIRSWEPYFETFGPDENAWQVILDETTVQGYRCSGSDSGPWPRWRFVDRTSLDDDREDCTYGNFRNIAAGIVHIGSHGHKDQDPMNNDRYVYFMSVWSSKTWEAAQDWFEDVPVDKRNGYAILRDPQNSLQRIADTSVI
jgi:hypothetical protein